MPGGYYSAIIQYYIEIKTAKNITLKGIGIMALSERMKVATKSKNLSMSVFTGHFSTGRSHSNYFIDITSQKSGLAEAKAVAASLAGEYKSNTLIDTVLCLDDTQVIATCLAEELVRNDYASINSNNSINILTPEQTAASQLLFRDNTAPMIRNKRVLILAATVVTGFTAKSAIDAVNYYGGQVAGIACIYSTVTECMGIPVKSAFNINDLPDYRSYSSFECPMCKAGQKIDALVNNYGISEL